MAIDHLKVNNVFELGKDEGTDYIILPCKVLYQNAITLVVYLVRLKMSTQMRRLSPQFKFASSGQFSPSMNFQS